MQTNLTDKLNGVHIGIIGILCVFLIIPDVSIKLLTTLDSWTYLLFGDINQICITFILINIFATNTSPKKLSDWRIGGVIDQFARMTVQFYCNGTIFSGVFNTEENFYL